MMRLSPRQQQLLTAALARDDDMALQAWRAWLAFGPMETAPHEELRILPAVYARLARIRPLPQMPQKLAGKARATFTLNTILATAGRDCVETLNGAGIPVLVTKGLAHCLRHGAFSRRTMGDVDIVIAEEHLPAALRQMQANGWTPRYGLTPEGLLGRVAGRRASWNFTKGPGNVDLHWRMSDAPGTDPAEAPIWAGAERVAYQGFAFQIPCAEAALYLALRHADAGTEADKLQMLADAPDWLASVRLEKMAALPPDAAVSGMLKLIAETLPGLGLPVPWQPGPAARARRRPVPRLPREDNVLRLPRLYALWSLIGQPAWMERLIIARLGPFSKPLLVDDEPRRQYDLRVGKTMDAIAGPGWGWPEPEHTCVWADRRDARLLLTLPSRKGQVLALTLGPHHHASLHPRFRIFANGHEITRAGGDGRATMVIPLRASLLRGNWVELSLRVPNWRADASLREMRTVAAAKISFAGPMWRPASHNLPDGTVRDILSGDAQKQAKLARIREKMAQSPFASHPDMPADFDGLSYVLLYPDLFEAEVDPYEHYLASGKREQRVW